ncbi:MAG: hypothetical protein GY868_13190, partial [Deltaproteobacteria bacterium]|nr:hypothetical protein [Deltaproteobacteria bacterium]
MKILLLNPPTETDRKFIREGRCTQEQGVWGTLWPPVSLAVIGAVLERDGHAVSIHDCPAEDILRPALVDIIRADVPGLVIWSSGTPTIQSDLQLAREIKAVCRDIITAVFGTHVTVLDQQCLGAFPDLDCIIRNEPEETARELAGAAQSGKNLQAVQGLTWRSSA